MFFVLSPAKTLDETTPAPTQTYTQSPLLKHSAELIKVCRKLSPQDIAELMKVSDKIAVLNTERFGDWATPFDLKNAKQAVYLFKGDVYEGLDAYHLTAKATDYLQQHLGILSGLYGILKPLDLMQPYRLEMGTKLSNPKGANLYAYWGQIIAKQINQYMRESGQETLINLASNEYFKAVDKKTLAYPIVTPIFKDKKNGEYKIISFYAKRARGLMVKYAAENQLNSPEALKNFDLGGYYYSADHSNGNEWVFLREEQ
ncbi:MAG: peroxide stress protein YaaA [Neisseriaceae bacterium]|nr:peroxide stress protein YaaA [Neisseriaceae bacterium]MBP6861328.1 peroxide stress protein YaaA [Neisseriaceae bacterium]